MNDKKNHWLKLKTDFFPSLAIKKMRKIAGGDTYVIIYLKLMLLTLNSEGHYRYQRVEQTIEDELATILDEDIENIKICLSLAKSFGLLENVNDNTIFLSQVPTLIGKRDDSRDRVREYRERKKLSNAENISENAKITACNALHLLHVTACNDRVTQCNAPREEKIREDNKLHCNLPAAKLPEEEDPNEKIQNKPKEERIPHQEIVELFHRYCGDSMPSLRELTEARKKSIKARWKTTQPDIKEWERYFKIVASSNFLMGRQEHKDEKVWDRCTFDWLICPRNVIKVLEGNYTNRPRN